jgi:hypothetical protein
MPRSPLPRLRKACFALPDVHEKISHGEPTFWAGRKMFASFADANNHHGNGRYAVWVKSTPLTQDMLVSRWPSRYFVPPYVGVSGWVGIYLDTNTDWDAVAERLADGYRLVASKKLRQALDAPTSGDAPSARRPRSAR